MNYQNTIYVRLKEFKFKKSEDGALSKLYDVSAVVSGDSDCRHLRLGLWCDEDFLVYRFIIPINHMQMHHLSHLLQLYHGSTSSTSCLQLSAALASVYRRNRVLRSYSAIEDTVQTAVLPSSDSRDECNESNATCAHGCLGTIFTAGSSSLHLHGGWAR